MSILRHSDEHSDEHSDDESPVRAERVDGRSASPKEPGAFEPDDLDDPRLLTTVAPRAVVAALAVPTSYASYVGSGPNAPCHRKTISTHVSCTGPPPPPTRI